MPTILRYVVVECERRGYQVFWREPGEREWRCGPAETRTPVGVPEFGFEVTLNEVYAGMDSN